MRVEAGRDHDQVRRETFEPRQDHALQRVAEFLAAIAGRSGALTMVSCSPRSSPRRCPDRAASGGSSSTSRCGRPEDLLRAVAVMHVEIDDGDALDAVLLLRMAAAIAALLNRQNPIGRAVSAWWPGGRVATNALAALPVITSSTACTAPPAARSAASKLPGDIEVSASSRTMPSGGAVPPPPHTPPSESGGRAPWPPAGPPPPPLAPRLAAPAPPRRRARGGGLPRPPAVLEARGVGVYEH